MDEFFDIYITEFKIALKYDGINDHCNSSEILTTLLGSVEVIYAVIINVVIRGI